MNRREGLLLLLVAGTGFFAFNRATEPGRRESRRKTCQSNLNRIGWGVMQYLQDYDDTYPRAWFGRDAGPSDASKNYKWMDAVFPYVKDEKLFSCPEDKVSAPYRFRSGTSYGSYVMNNAYAKPGDSQTAPPGRKAKEVMAQTVMLADGEKDFQFTWPDAPRTPRITGDNPFRLGSIRGRHGAGIYRTASVANSEGVTTTAVFNFLRLTNQVGKQKIYPMLTIEDDETGAVLN
ncbi:DUF1559 domain-containing protein [bacterium]|nr:MAG: DUF1559 domain-containing protein [bacterium]